MSRYPNCAHCGEEMRPAQRFSLQCRHVFHQSCLQEVVEQVIEAQEVPLCPGDANTCPYELTSREIDKVSVYEISHIKDIIKHYEQGEDNIADVEVYNCEVVWKNYTDDGQKHYQELKTIAPHIVAAYYRKTFCVLCGRGYRSLGLLENPRFYFELNGKYCDNCDISILVSTDPLVTTILNADVFGDSLLFSK